MILSAMIFLADVPVIPISTTGAWILGLIGALSIGTIILVFLNQWKKFFGRRPPIDEELDRREKMLRDEITAGDEALGKRIDQVNDQYLSLQAERERNWKELNAHISEVSNDVAFIRGKMDPLFKPSAHRTRGL